MNNKAFVYYEFGPFRLNVTDRLLMRGEEIVSLTPKVVDTLIMLVEHGGHVLTKDALISQLWPDSFVEESSLAQNISLLRKALAEKGNLQNCIETIPKRGYRFVAEVHEITEPNSTSGEFVLQERTSSHIVIEEQFVDDSKSNAEPAGVTIVYPARPGRDWRVWYAAVASCVLIIVASAVYYLRPAGGDSITLKSIAVLPFTTIGSQSEPDVIGLGMADAVILKLTRLNRTTVLPVSSVFKYAGHNHDVLTVGRDLGVDAILDGTIQREGDRVRVSAALIRLRDGKTIWAQKFDDRYTNIFSVQDAISDQLARALVPSIGGSAIELPPARLTESTEAYEAYLMGFHFWTERSKENLPKAIKYLEDAVNKDAKFAKAHALLADSYYLSYHDEFRLLSRSEALSKARISVERALALDDMSPEAHTAKAGIATTEMNYDDADKEYRLALEQNPNYAIAHLRYAYFLFFYDFKLDQALIEAKRAVKLDPASPTPHLTLGYLLLMARDFDSALLENEKAVELQPDRSAARVNLAETYILKRMFKEAQMELDKLDPADPLVGRERAYLYAVSGRTDEAHGVLARLKSSSGQAALNPYDYSVLYGALGEMDSAFESLRRTSPGRSTNAMLRFDPFLDPLRSDTRFSEIVNRSDPKIAGLNKF